MRQPLISFISTMSGLILLFVTATGSSTSAETTCGNCTTKVETQDDGTTSREYKRGNRVCGHESEALFKQDSENLDHRYFYASCQVIKGQDS